MGAAFQGVHTILWGLRDVKVSHGTCSWHGLEVALLGGLHGAQEAPHAALILFSMSVLRGQVQGIFLPVQHLQRQSLVSRPA